MLFQYVNIESNNVVFFKFVENLLKATSKEMLEFINLKKVIEFLVNQLKDYHFLERNNRDVNQNLTGYLTILNKMISRFPISS